MKRILFALATVGLLVSVSCQKQGSDLQDRLDRLEDRIAALEAQVTTINDNIKSLQDLVGALGANLTVSSVTPNDGGFIIKFSDGTSYTIANGIDGKDGVNAPVIGIKQDTDGIWYWTLDGEWMLQDGAKVAAQGADGTDGTTPALKAEEGWWYVSYDGTTWEKLAEVNPSAGVPQIEVTEDDDYVYFKQSDGTVIKIRKTSEFGIDVQEEVEFSAADPVEIPYTITKADETVKFDILEQNGGYTAEIVPAEDNASGVIKITPPATIVPGSILLSAVKNSTGEIRMKYIYFKSAAAKEVTLTWDFSASEWQEVFAPLGEPATNYEGWDFTVNGLRYLSTGSSRWNTTYIQTGGGGNTGNRVFIFTAPAAGTLKVWSSNTGGSEDLTRLVKVQVGESGEPQSNPGGSPSTDAPTESTFEVGAGQVYVYPSSGLRFYKLEFTYTTGGGEPEPETVTKAWNFTTLYTADINVTEGALYLLKDDGTVEAATAMEEDKLYLSPNGKAIKSNNKACTADGITYHPVSYGGGAAYLTFTSSHAIKLKVTATIGKDPANAESCKLGIKVGGTAYGTDVDLAAYDLSVAGCAAKDFEWEIANEAGTPQEIQIVKPSGANSPWIFAVEYTYSK